MNEETPDVLIQRVYCKRVKTIIIIIIIITHAKDMPDSLYAINNTEIKINTTTVNVFVSSVNRTWSVALLIDSSDRQNRHDVPFNGDRVATALATHWIHPVRGEVFKSVGANGRRYLTKERAGAQKQQ